jgi:hypothetical protein
VEKRMLRTLNSRSAESDWMAIAKVCTRVPVPSAFIEVIVDALLRKYGSEASEGGGDAAGGWPQREVDR